MSPRTSKRCATRQFADLARTVGRIVTARVWCGIGGTGLVRVTTPRVKRLPVAPLAPPARRDLPLAADARVIDRACRPILAVWELTLACDLACGHCGSRAGRARPDELSTAEALDLVDQLAELGVIEVVLIGGEAYLRDDWCDIVARVAARGMQPLLTTGGRGMTRERADAAAKAGLVSASVSLDGLEATHDHQRAVAGAFAAAITAMANLHAAGIAVSVNTQINRLSMRELPELVELVIAHGGHSWQLQLTAAMGRAADRPAWILQPYDLLELFPMLEQLAQRCRAADVVLWPGNNVGYFGPYETTLRGTTPRGHAVGCGAGVYGLGIEANGTIKGCPSMATSTWASGNVRDARLVDIWERGGAMRYNRARGVESLWGFCASCYYADTCMGGCTWTAEALLGRPGNNPLCHHRALEMARLGQARAARTGGARAGRAVRSRAVRAGRRGPVAGASLFGRLSTRDEVDDLPQPTTVAVERWIVDADPDRGEVVDESQRGRCELVARSSPTDLARLAQQPGALAAARTTGSAPELGGYQDQRRILVRGARDRPHGHQRRSDPVGEPRIWSCGRPMPCRPPLPSRCVVKGDDAASSARIRRRRLARYGAAAVGSPPWMPLLRYPVQPSKPPQSISTSTRPRCFEVEAIGASTCSGREPSGAGFCRSTVLAELVSALHGGEDRIGSSVTAIARRSSRRGRARCRREHPEVSHDMIWRPGSRCVASRYTIRRRAAARRTAGSGGSAAAPHPRAPPHPAALLRPPAPRRPHRPPAAAVAAARRSRRPAASAARPSSPACPDPRTCSRASRLRTPPHATAGRERHAVPAPAAARPRRTGTRAR